MEKLLERNEVAQYLGKSEQWVRKAVARGELSAVRIGRSLRFRQRDVENYLSRVSVGAVNETKYDAWGRRVA